MKKYLLSCLLSAVAVSANALDIRDSSNFVNSSGSGGLPGSYESSVLPNADDPAWVVSGGGNLALVDGLLRFTTRASGEGVSATTGYATSSAVPDENFWAKGADLNKGFTVETRLRVNSVDPNASAEAATGLFLFHPTTTGRVDVLFGSDFIRWTQGSSQTFSGLDLTTDLVTVRVAWDPDGGEGSGAYSLWYNQTLLSDELTGGNIASSLLRFGDPSANLGGVADVEYVRWDFTGAYAPIPEPSTTVAFTILVVLGVSLYQRRQKR